MRGYSENYKGLHSFFLGVQPYLFSVFYSDFCIDVWNSFEWEDTSEEVALPGDRLEQITEYQTAPALLTANNSDGQTLTAGGDSGIINPDERGTAVSDVHYIGKIDVNIYKCVTEDIVSDEVIITDAQVSHIQARHPGVFEKYGKYFEEVVSSPDYILEANKPNTALVLKQIPTENGYTKMALRLHTSADDPSYKNSVITFVEIDERDWNRLLRNKKVLYKHE